MSAIIHTGSYMCIDITVILLKGSEVDHCSTIICQETRGEARIVYKAPEFDCKSIAPRWNWHIRDDVCGHLNMNRGNSNNVDRCV